MLNLARLTYDQRKQLLKIHLERVAGLASSDLPDFLKTIAYYAGLWHDIGKYSPKWQDYLQNNGKKKIILSKERELPYIYQKRKK